MKTKEELNAIKEEVETANRKLQKLNDEQLTQVSGGKDGPEEFEWHTPPRQSEENGWKFSATGNVEGQFFKIIESGKKRDWRKDSSEW